MRDSHPLRVVREGALALEGLLLLPLLIPFQDVRDVAPVNPDARLPRDIRDGLAAIDPSAVGWGSEVLSEAVGGILADLEDALATGETDDLQRSGVEGFTCTALVSGDWEASGAFEYRVLSSGEGEVGLGELVSRLRGHVQPGEVRASLKVIGLTLVGSTASTRLRVEVVGGGDNRSQVVGQFLANWRIDDEAQPLLQGLQLEEGVVTRSPSPLFTEVTAAALAGPHLEQLGPGLGYWRDRLDTRVGVGILGHHGVAIGDVDGDGLEDLYLCQPGGLPNRLFLRQADGTTLEVASKLGLDVLDSTQSALILDLDGDGAREVILAVSDRLAIFKNGGANGFRGAALVQTVGATSLAAADVDLDGDLDLFACGYDSPYEGRSTPQPYHDAENGQRNYLFLNDGELRFTDNTFAAGLSHRRYSFAASFEDVDDDGDPDLYVANDFGRNNLYLNSGDGTFVDKAVEWGVEDLSAGMGVSFADVDGDGRMDLHVSNMFSAAGNRVAYQERFQADGAAAVRADFRRHARGNSLYLNRGSAFEDVSDATGVAMGRWAWGGVFLDMENDGLPDLYVPNGFVTGDRGDDL